MLIIGCYATELGHAKKSMRKIFNSRISLTRKLESEYKSCKKNLSPYLRYETCSRLQCLHANLLEKK